MPRKPDLLRNDLGTHPVGRQPNPGNQPRLYSPIKLLLSVKSQNTMRLSLRITSINDIQLHGPVYERLKKRERTSEISGLQMIASYLSLPRSLRDVRKLRKWGS